MQTLIAALSVQSVDPNSTADLGLAPLHAIIVNKRKDRAELLQTLLIHGQVDIDLCIADGNTGLHLAVLVSFETPYSIALGSGMPK